jgi:hypothetical protein
MKQKIIKKNYGTKIQSTLTAKVPHKVYWDFLLPLQAEIRKLFPLSVMSLKSKWVTGRVWLWI